jgi:hypothetical protein
MQFMKPILKLTNVTNEVNMECYKFLSRNTAICLQLLYRDRIDWKSLY